MSTPEGVWFSYFDHAGWHPQPSEDAARKDAAEHDGRAVFVPYDTSVEVALDAQ